MKHLSTLYYQLSTIAIALAMTACAPQAPQRPSQRSGQEAQPDSATLAMVELHQRLADAADRELGQYRRNHPGRWFEQEDGSWVCLGDSQQATDGRQQTAGDVISLHLVTRDLQGNLLLDEQGEYELGMCQLPPAVENALNSQLINETASLHSPLTQRASTLNYIVLAPWYVAYGSKGNGQVPRYQNVIIEVDIL